jgi:hypothetical protein
VLVLLIGRPASAADLAVEVFLFDQDDAVLTDDSACEVCNPCSFTVPDGARDLRVSISELMFHAGGTWPAGLTGVQAVVYVAEASAHVSLRPLAGADPALDVSVTSPDWSLDHVVDFFMDRTVTPPHDEDDSCDGTNGCPDNDYYTTNPVPFTPAVFSDEVIAGPSAVRVYQALLDGGTTATWSWQEGDHCDSYQEIGNTAPVIDAVVMGLGVEAVRHELRVVKHEDNFTATNACLEYDAGLSENTFSDSETLAVNGRTYRVGTYHDSSGSPELQATIANGAEFFLPDLGPSGIATVDRVAMLIAGSTGATYEDLTVTFTYRVGITTQTESVTAQVPKDDVSVGSYSGNGWDVLAWTGDVTGNGASCDDGAFEVRIRNPRLTADVASIEVTYGGDLAGPLALTILTDAAAFDQVVDDNDGACEVTTPFTTACVFEPVRTYWN